MKIDEILEGLSNMRQHMMYIDGIYSVDQARARMLTISCMRDFVLEENASGFTAYCQDKMTKSSCDMMVDLLEELYEELGISADSTYDYFESKFLM